MSAELLDCGLMRSAVLRTVLPLLLSLGLSPTVLASDVTFFETRIRPVLARSCFKCHSTKSRKPKGELLLDSRDSVLKGGETGPAVVPGNLEVSLLVRAVRYEDEDLQMPPSGKLPDEVVADFERWVRDGAPFPSAASQPPTGTPWWKEIDPLQLLAAETPISEAVDHYVELRLEREGVRGAAPVSDAQFLRRLSLDLVGRVPTLREVADSAATSASSDSPESEDPS